MNFEPADPSLSEREIHLMLDGLPVELPAGRRSLPAIRSFLETLALEHQRILCALTVDGHPTDLAQLPATTDFTRVEGESIELNDMPLQLLKTARQQTAAARADVTAAVSLVLINEAPAAREFWWKLTRELKEPLLTLSLLPEDACGLDRRGTSLKQLRKWQLQQLAAIIKDVDAACWAEDTAELATALETRCLPWLEKLHEMICLWDETACARLRLTPVEHR
jgi:hypothetical protein